MRCCYRIVLFCRAMFFYSPIISIMYVYFDILYFYEEFISSIVKYFFITFLSHGRDVTERH